jgi:hypothetical protein
MSNISSVTDYHGLDLMKYCRHFCSWIWHFFKMYQWTAGVTSSYHMWANKIILELKVGFKSFETVKKLSILYNTKYNIQNMHISRYETEMCWTYWINNAIILHASNTFSIGLKKHNRKFIFNHQQFHITNIVANWPYFTLVIMENCRKHYIILTG